jgi:hypothetical protein
MITLAVPSVIVNPIGSCLKPELKLIIFNLFQSGILSSESVKPPPEEETSGKVCVALDAFLYDEVDEEKFVAEGTLSRLEFKSLRGGLIMLNVKSIKSNEYL